MTKLERSWPKITVCVCTYKRPVLLRTLLDGLAAQTYPQSAYEIVVVDNDAKGSASSKVHDAISHLPLLKVRYSVEPMQGISHARNHTVSLATGELLAFIDDDEYPMPNWLEELVLCIEAHCADAVMGPILPSYPANTPNWVHQTRFFERKRYPTGVALTWGDGHTGNALVKASWAKKRKPDTFDVNLARSGGEDTDFFKWIATHGGRLTWCDSAVVHEEISPSRQRVQFMLERSLISSVTYWRPHYAQHGRLWCYRNASLGLLKAVLHVMTGVLKLPFGFGHAVAQWTESAKGLGRLVALSKADMVSYGKEP